MDKEQCLKLIQLYGEFRRLSYAQCPDYTNRGLKKDAWRKISQEMNLPIDVLKKKMESLLGSYRREKSREKKSRVTGSSRGELYVSNWYAYEAFSFLEDKNHPGNTTQDTLDEEVDEEMSNNPSPSQIDTLLTFLEEHPELARGALRNTQGRIKSKSLWDRLTDELNSLGGCQKTVKQWQKVWADKKYLAKKTAAVQRSALASEAGPSSAVQLSEQDARIVALIGESNSTWDMDRQARAFTPPILKRSRDDSSPSSPDFPDSAEEARPRRKCTESEPEPNIRERLIQIEEERLATEKQQTQELILLRQSIQDLGRVVQSSFQEMLAELKTWRQ